MGAPAAVSGDKIVGTCASHRIIGPLGAPVPAPPMPFSAMLVLGLATTVLIGGKPAAVVGSNGLNVPPHVGLHPTDAAVGPPLQKGTVISGSSTVLIEGKPAATAQSRCTMCAGPASTLVASAADVLIG